MSAFQMGTSKAIEGIEANLAAATKSSLDELLWWDLMRLGLLNQRAPPFLSAEWNGSFCAIATDSGPSTFGHCWTPCRERRRTASGPEAAIQS